MKFYKIAKFGDDVKNIYIKQGIPKDAIDSYINNFDIIRKRKDKELFDDIANVTVPKNKRQDISAYQDFHQLEMVVDYVKGQKQIGNKQEGSIDVPPIYENEGLKIYRADNARQAIAIKGSWPINWCIAAEGASNLFNAYRYKDHEPTFYFVKDDNMDSTNKYHFFVIQVTKMWPYIVTSALNQLGGGDVVMNWNEILEIQPKLKGLQSIFKHIPLTKEERKNYNRFKDGISDEEFIKLPYEDKIMYLDIAGLLNMNSVKFSNLPRDLKSHYISFGVGLDDDMFEMIRGDKKLIERYKQITERKLEKFYENPDLGISFTDSEMNILDIYNNPTKEFINTINSLIEHNRELPDFAVQWVKKKMDSPNPPEYLTNTISKSIEEHVGDPYFGYEWAKGKMDSPNPPEKWIEAISEYIETNGYPPHFALEWAMNQLNSPNPPEKWIEVISEYIEKNGSPPNFAKEWTMNQLNSNNPSEFLVEYISNYIKNNGYLPNFAIEWAKNQINSPNPHKSLIEAINDYIKRKNFIPYFAKKWYEKNQLKNQAENRIDNWYKKSKDDSYSLSILNNIN